MVIPGAWEGFLEEAALSQASERSRTVCSTGAGPILSEGTDAGAMGGRGWGRGRGETSMAWRVWHVTAKT